MKIRFQGRGIKLPRWKDVPVGSVTLRYFKGQAPAGDDPVLFFKAVDNSSVGFPFGDLQREDYMNAPEYTYQVLDAELVIK